MSGHETLRMSTGTSSLTYTIEDGERVYPCRCGHTHRGDYAFEDWRHHNCFHPGPLLDISDEWSEPRTYLICGSCGQTFNAAENSFHGRRHR